MAPRPGGLYSRRQFLGGMGALGVAAAVPLRGAWPERPSRLAGLTTSVAQSAGQTSATPVLFSDDFRRELAGSHLWRWETFSGVGTSGTTAFGQAVGLRGALAVRGHGDVSRKGMTVSLTNRRADPSIAGRMRTIESFPFEAGRRYRLELRFAAPASPGGGGAVQARLPGVGVSKRLQLPRRHVNRPVVLEFTPASPATSRVEVTALGAPTSAALLLDSVRLSEVA